MMAAPALFLFAFTIGFHSSNAQEQEVSYLQNPTLIDLYYETRFAWDRAKKESEKACSHLKGVRDKQRSKKIETIKEAQNSETTPGAKLAAISSGIGAIRSEFGKCVLQQERKNPPELTFPLHGSPTSTSPEVGKLIFSYSEGPSINGEPETRFEILVEDPAGKRTKISSELLDQYIDERPFGLPINASVGSWMSIPKKPLPSASWFDLSKFNAIPRPLSTQEWVRIKTKTFTGAVQFLRVEGDQYYAEYSVPEMDLSCKGQDSSYKRFTIKIPIRELYDKDQHLQVKPAKLGGCMDPDD